jgi:Asp-tRNA(Asn)/Glu-tRNA(Gln) amidotransferase C subunit
MERRDEPRESMTLTDVLANAPESDPDAGLFRVPRVIAG